MTSKSFHKDMDEYLRKKSVHSRSPVVCNTKNTSFIAKFTCWIQLSFFQIKQFKQRCIAFFKSTDEVDLQSLQSDVVVVHSHESPASVFWRKCKAFFGFSKNSKNEQRIEPDDIDPKLVQETIKNSKL